MAEAVPGTKIYVGNMSFQTTEGDLRDLFERSGRVKEVSIAMGNDGRPRGFAFVHMEEAADADRAVADTNGKDVNGRTLRVEVSSGVRGERGPRGGDRDGGRGGGGGGGYRGGGGGGGGGDTCRDFQRGDCSRGTSCRFSHEGGGGGGGGRGNDRDGGRGGGGYGGGGGGYGRDRDDRYARDGGRDRSRERDYDRRDDRRSGGGGDRERRRDSRSRSRERR